MITSKRSRGMTCIVGLFFGTLAMYIGGTAHASWVNEHIAYVAPGWAALNIGYMYAGAKWILGGK